MMRINLDKTRWLSLMARMGFDSHESVFVSLVEHYDQSHRHYHDLTHLHAVLTRLDEARQLARQA